jgi:hypothetical protein
VDFATDQEYTVFALLAAGQFATAEDGMRSLAQVSIIANHDSGKMVHETVTDGSVYFGLNDEPGDIDETAKFPYGMYEGAARAVTRVPTRATDSRPSRSTPA